MTQPKPKVTGTVHTLPFDKLAPLEFERLCLWLLEREGYEDAEHLGAAGREQGRDIVAWREGAQWAFQCKRVKRFRPKDALKEVEKVLALPEDQRPTGLVFLVTCVVSANTRQQVRDRCVGTMECRFWGVSRLDERIKRHPDIMGEFFLELGPWVLDISPSALKKHAITETICIALATLAILISEHVVRLTATFDQVILGAVICTPVLAVPVHLLSRWMQRHIHFWVATVGSVGLLALFWSVTHLFF